MSSEVADRQGVLGDPVDAFCGERLDCTVYELLHHQRDRLFGDELFADLFTTRVRRSIPPSVVACVLVLKQLEGLSHVEAIDRSSTTCAGATRVGSAVGRPAGRV